jgi:hypothetical protein
MEDIYKSISKEDYQILKEAIPLITILIGGADGDIDLQERAWAEKVTRIRSYASEDEYLAYYEDVGLDFQKKLQQLLEELPADPHERTALISSRLEGLNPVLKKMEPKVGHQFYTEFLSFAEHVAKASGGFLGFWSIGPEEKKLIKLPMLQEIEYVESEDEEDEKEKEK